MDISAKHQDLTSILCNMLVIGVFEDDKTLTPSQKKLDSSVGGLISDYLIKKEGFKAKFADSEIVPTYLKIPSDKIMLVGLGKKREFDCTKLTELCAKIAKQLDKALNVKNICLELLGLHCGNFDANKCAQAMSEGILLSLYDFDKYKNKKSTPQIKKVRIALDNPKDEKAAKAGVSNAKIICSAMDFTKDLINEPAQSATPETISEIAKNLATELNLSIKVYNKKQLENMNFNTFLAVAQGSEREPKFINLVYKPAKKARKKIVLIGKGITFDSGGLDIKPANSMLTMKTDMSGCATVLGIIQTIAALKPDVEVHALSALCENMPSGTSYKQGDIITAKNGKTIEVDNTDAEGRLTLADVLTFADELEADEVIDIATLTGACIVALGQNITGIMGNNPEQIKRIIEKGKECGEALWELPIFDDMQEMLKSDVADMRNTGSRFAGASVAGRFLQNFTKCKNWVHLDIAGTAFIDKPYKELNKGATGVLIRTLTNYIMSI